MAILQNYNTRLHPSRLKNSSNSILAVQKIQQAHFLEMRVFGIFFKIRHGLMRINARVSELMHEFRAFALTPSEIMKSNGVEHQDS